jgi:hypothetical protein
MARASSTSYTPAGAWRTRPPRGSRRPGRGPWFAIVALVVVVAALGAVAFRAGSHRAPASSPATQGAANTYLVSARTSAVRVCLDATTGFGFSYAFPRTVRTQLATAVAALAPPAGAPPTVASGPLLAAPQNGLDLLVRPVDTRANSTSPQVTRFSAHIVVPPVAGLRPGPDLSTYPVGSEGDDRFAADERQFSLARADVSSARAAGRSAAAAGSAQLRALPLDDADSTLSDQVGCLSSLVELSAGQAATYVVFSDLQPTVPPQIGSARVHAGRLIVIQPCDGDEAQCDAWLSTFEAAARQLGFTRISSVRPEISAPLIRQLLTKG